MSRSDQSRGPNPSARKIPRSVSGYPLRCVRGPGLRLDGHEPFSIGKRMQNELRNNQLLGCLGLVLFVGFVGGLFFLWVTDSAFESIYRGGSGPVESSEDWPRPLKALAASAEESGVEMSNVFVHCLGNGLVIEYLWRMDSNSQLMELVTQEFNLKPYAPSNDGRFRSQSWTPEWWDPHDESTNAYFCANLDGLGDRFVVFHDKSKQKIFVHYILD